MFRKTPFVFSLLIILQFSLFSQNEWTYIQVDSTKDKFGDYDSSIDWLRYFGLDAADLNDNGYKDIISGRYIYFNPGGNMEGSWNKIDIGFNIDAMLITDIDGDEYMDIIGESLPDVWWIEADNIHGTRWKAKIVGQVKATGHKNGQGFELAELVNGGKPEIILSGGGGMWACEIPEDLTEEWEFVLIAPSESEEGIGTGDLDGDGDTDLAIGFVPEGHEHPTELMAFYNPGNLEEKWETKVLGHTETAIDRVEITDFNGDSKPDVVISEERWPGLEPNANLFWFENGEEWERHLLYTGFSLNNLDVGDIDNDGDMDVVSSEHKGTDYPTMGFYNDGNGNFEMKIIDNAKESHLGNQLFDMDNDGDLDMISAGWDHHNFMHLWRNDLIMEKYNFKVISSIDGDIDGDLDLDISVKPYNWMAPRAEIWLNKSIEK